MAEDLKSRIQASLGDAFTLERELGGGGMSRTYLAQETALNRRVVVKVLSPDLAQGVSVDRFKREIQLAAAIQHPHIVPVLSAGEVDGLPYYTMPFVAGESLRARLAQGPLPVAEVLSVLRDVARALAYAHQQGVVHRDIKPDNVLLAGHSAAVADFGIAKAISAARTGAAEGATLTQLGTALGTPSYMAPEQAAGDPNADHRVDLYAFGIMAYELLTGRPPFHSLTPQKLLAAHMGERPVHVSAIRGDTPPSLADLVMRCLEKDAGQRPASASDIVRFLDTVSSGSGQAAAPRALLEPRVSLAKALAVWAGASVAAAVLARAAIVGIGLPDWVLPGAILVMALGLPMIVATAWVHRTARDVLSGSVPRTPGGTVLGHGTAVAVALKASPHLTWRRTTMGGVAAAGAFAVLVAGYMLLRALGVGSFGSLQAAGALDRRAPMLMTDFRVVNADSTLGDVISQAVRSNLEQSNAVTLVPRTATALALRRMQRPATTPIDLALAQEVATREGIQAIVDGEVAGIGAGFLLTLRLVSADSARTLASFRQAADGPTELIDAVDALTRKLRGKIGESLRAVQASPRLAEVTTASIDALRKYTEAVRATSQGEYAAAAALAREAVALDTGFALAYRHLAEALDNAGVRSAEVDSALARAYRLRDRLSERERLTVTAEYFATGPGRDRAKAIEAYERQASLGDFTNTNSLGILLASRRQFARADSFAQIRARVDPGFALTYSNRVLWLLLQGRADQADSISDVITERFPQYALSRQSRILLLMQRGDDQAAIALMEADRRSPSPQLRAEAAWVMMALAQRAGRLRDAERLAREASAEDSARGLPLRAAENQFREIIDAAWFSPESAALVNRVDAAVSGPAFVNAAPQDRPYLAAAHAYARAGDGAKARAMLARYEREVRDTARRRAEQPQVNRALGEIALAERRPLDAVPLFRRGDSLPDGPADACAECLPAALARAFDAANLPDSASAAIERYFAVPLRPGSDRLYRAPFTKRLAELYEARGDLARAAGLYQQFIDSWKNADPELQPAVRQARERLARIQARIS